MIYLDMDGVLADFEKLVMQRFGFDVNANSSKLFWKLHKYDVFEDETFFCDLELMPGAMKLYTVASIYDDVAILTATGHINSKAVSIAKRRWIDKHFPGASFNHVPKSADKAQFAAPGALLVDDREKSIIPFREAGGNAIHYKHADQAIRSIEFFYKRVR